jgi:cobalt transporter subunit CbtB
MQQSHTADLSIATKDLSTVFQAVLAMGLGLFIIGIVGFSHIDVIHNATHDVRHSNAFPCH